MNKPFPFFGEKRQTESSLSFILKNANKASFYNWPLLNFDGQGLLMSYFAFMKTAGFLIIAFLTACNGKNEPDITQKALKCDHTNYQKFIFNKEKTNQLISLTGKGCQLESVDFRKVPLKGAYLPKANLQSADLRGVSAQSVILTDSDLRKSKIQGAKFTGADIRGVDFTDADWSSRSFVSSWMTRPDFKDANYNSKTRFPKGLRALIQKKKI